MWRLWGQKIGALINYTCLFLPLALNIQPNLWNDQNRDMLASLTAACSGLLCSMAFRALKSFLHIEMLIITGMTPSPDSTSPDIRDFRTIYQRFKGTLTRVDGLGTIFCRCPDVCGRQPPPSFYFPFLWHKKSLNSVLSHERLEDYVSHLLSQTHALSSGNVN